MIFKGLEASESRAARDQFMPKRRLVLFKIVVLVDLLVVVFILVYNCVIISLVSSLRIVRELNVPQKPILNV